MDLSAFFPSRGRCTGMATKTWKIMRITTILLLAGALQLSARTKAQTVTLDVKNAPLQKVFREIHRQTGFQFFYKDALLNQAGPVTLSVHNAPLGQVLDQCFKNLLFTYTIQDGAIIVREKETANEATAAPPNDIHGRVTDSLGTPMAGASVTVKGTKTGIQTDANGDFVLRGIDPANAVLVISFTGYGTQQVALKGRTAIALVLRAEVGSLQDVVINKGYYTEKQLYTVGNVARITSQDIEKQPINNPLLALEGQVPGLYITQNTGVSGTAVTVRIQGQNSLQKGNEPLIIIDGVPFTSEFNSTQPDFIGNILGSAAGTVSNGNPLGLINPNDIESIEVLKDADATAIYGSRAANGAILITTKRGKAGKTTVNLNVQNGIGHIAKKMDLLNTGQYLQMRREALKNDNVTAGSPDYDLNGTWDTTRNIDWQKELIGNTAKYSDAQASVSGGTSQIQYLMGGGYHRETTVFPGDYADQKASVHFNLSSSSLNQKFKVSLSGNYLFDINKLPSGDLTPSALRLAPVAPPLTNPDGSLNWAPNSLGNTTWANGIHPLVYTIRGYQTEANNLIGNSVVSYELLSSLTLKANLGYTNLQTNETATIPLTSYAPERRSNATRVGIFSNNSITSWIVEPQLNYHKTIARGTLDLLAGATVNQMHSDGQVLYGSGFISDALINDVKSAASLSVDASIASIYKYSAFYGRVNYNFNDRYIVNATYRRDGSSRYGEKNRFHNFGSVGAAWIFTNELFFKGANDFLSLGKIRASYGTTGNDQIGDYQYLSLLSSFSVGVPYQNSVGLTINSLTNPYLQWEETKKIQAGLDLGFLKDRILINASYYHNRSSDELLNYALPIITGFNGIVRNFPATVDNYGWELSVNTVNIRTSKFTWSSSVNLTIPKNKLVAFPNLSTSTLSSSLVVGQPITIFKLYHYIGVDPQTGIYQYADAKGTPTTRPDTAYKLTQSVVANLSPKFYGGITNTLRYKRIELAFTMQFVKQIGQEYLFNSLPGHIGVGNQPKTVLGRWQKAGDHTDIQKYSQTFGAVSTGYSIATQSDLVYKDASFIRLKNASLSWLLPESVVHRMRIQSFRIYVQGENLLTFTKYIGLDPETRSSTSLPPLRVLTIGVQVSL